MTNHPRPCVGCRFYDGMDGQTCTNPLMARADAIQGSIQGYPPTLRKEDGKCGPDGAGWERKLTFREKVFVFGRFV